MHSHELHTTTVRCVRCSAVARQARMHLVGVSRQASTSIVCLDCSLNTGLEPTKYPKECVVLQPMKGGGTATERPRACGQRSVPPKKGNHIQCMRTTRSG
jgi:hypothetical protein